MRRRPWLAALCSALLLAAGAAAQTPEIAPAGSPSTGVVAPASEAGGRLIVTGRVLDRASGKPVADASVYLYQTDAGGYYTRDGNNDNRNPRLHAHLRTDERGAFEAATIRPGAYPRGGVPAHIHVVVQAPGFARREFEFVFDDDPLVDERLRERAKAPALFHVIVSPRLERGAGRIEHDILLDRS